MTRHALVFGATGSIGRHLVRAGRGGVRVTAAKRNEEPPRDDYTEIHHCAGAYRFGMKAGRIRGVS